MAQEKIPFWRNQRVLQIVGQAIVVLILIAVVAVLGSNLSRNFRQLGLSFGFGFLDRTASFGISDTVIPYRPTDPYLQALLVGLLNSLRVMILGIILASVLGITVGIGRLSDNWLVERIATVYVETIRNTPLLLQLFFWYFAVFLKLPSIDNAVRFPGPIFLTQRGMDIPWFAATTQTWLSIAVIIASVVLIGFLWQRRTRVMVQQGQSGQTLKLAIIALAVVAVLAIIFGLDWSQPQLNASANTIGGGLNLSPEFATILFGLVIYTAAFIAEVVRAGIQSVNRGQWEAARALGLKSGLVMQLVIFPQALRVMIPPLTSEYLNLAKNSSLAIAVGYADIYAVSNTTSNQTGRSLEMLLIVMSSYLTINLVIALIMNGFNRSAQMKER
ncbi:MAG: amino acid ABC transporter permease [Cyanophyceae cyanobacterium]